MLPKKGAIARIINAISNVNPITGRTFSARLNNFFLYINNDKSNEKLIFGFIPKL